MPPPPLDPLDFLGPDIFVAHILPRLDSLALARSLGVCRRWRVLAAFDELWEPLCTELWARRAHLPLQIRRAAAPLLAYRAFAVTMEDANRVELSPIEMCARIWEMRVKPLCGPYWLSLDPTSRGEAPLLRRFHCDHSVTALRPDDPIWGGQECVWKYVVKNGSEIACCNRQHVQINRWPVHHVVRLHDGRWQLDNPYASYTTIPDQELNQEEHVQPKTVGACPLCQSDV